MNKVAIVTGASSGIGLGLTRSLLERGDAVVAVSRDMSKKSGLANGPKLALLDADIGKPGTAARAAAMALEQFGRIDLLVNNAGIFMAKPFTDYTLDDLAQLVSTNLAGFVHPTQAVLKPMAAQGGGHIVNIGTSFAQQPVAGVPCALPILIKGGIEAATRSLALEYAGAGVRVNTVAAGIIDTPLHQKDSHGFLAGLSPARRLGTVQEMVDAVLFLDGARFVSGEILHVDGGAHAGRW